MFKPPMQDSSAIVELYYETSSKIILGMLSYKSSPKQANVGHAMTEIFKLNE